MVFRAGQIAILLGAFLALIAFATGADLGPDPTVALAHAPILLTGRNSTALTAPTLLDGRVSFAMYGVIEEPKAARYTRVVMPADSDLTVDILIPDLAPENSLDREQLPALTMTTPSGATKVLTATQYVPFHEPFTDTSYVTYVADRQPAEAGDYLMKIVGEVPCRFVLAVGYDDDRLWEAPNLSFGAYLAADAELASWYRTPPPVVNHR